MEMFIQLVPNLAVRTHVNPHGGLKQGLWVRISRNKIVFGPTLILTED